MNLKEKALEILYVRAYDRSINRLAHSPNTLGLIRLSTRCTCYVCREFFDPDGMLDARRAFDPEAPWTHKEFKGVWNLTVDMKDVEARRQNGATEHISYSNVDSFCGGLDDEMTFSLK